MAEDQDGGFSRDPRNVAELKFVGDEIAEEHDGAGRELFDAVSESAEVDVGGRCGESQLNRLSRGVRGAILAMGTLHRSCSRIQSAASVSDGVMKLGCTGQFFACQASSPSP